MSKLHYLVRINKDPYSDWGLRFPIFPVAWQPEELLILRFGASKEPLSFIFADCAKMVYIHHSHDIVPLPQDARSDRWIFTQLSRWLPNLSL